MPTIPSSTRALRTFGDNLYDARLAAKVSAEETAARKNRRRRLDGPLTQQELAARLGFIRASPISLWERSNHLPDPPTILKLATALGCAPAALLRDVLTPYDVLRGSTLAISRDARITDEPLDAEDEHWLALGRRAAKHSLRRQFAKTLAHSLRLIDARPALPDDTRRRGDNPTTRPRRSPEASRVERSPRTRKVS